jgi:hypothetical protein
VRSPRAGELAAAERGDTGRIVILDDVEGGAQLAKYDGLGLDAVALLETRIAHLDRHYCGWAVVLRQNRLQHLCAEGVSAPGDLEGKLRSQRADAFGTGTLPLRPHQPQV